MSRIFNSNNTYYLDQSIKKETQKEIEKLFDKEDVISWSNSKDARQYIGKEGYFADSLEKLEEAIKNGIIHTLIEVGTDVSCFKEHECKFRFGLFLPADKVKEVEEKKYRPFSLEEFLSKFSVGTKISFRRRDMTGSVYGLFEGYQTDKDETEAYHKIIICNLQYTLNDLFERYEYLDEHGEWQPFGVEE